MKCVTLFSGCGGLDLGLAQAGFDIVFANDIDDHCSESYQKNFIDHPFYHGSVSDINLDLIAKISKGTANGNIDLLAGGPPCQSFSKSRFYRKDKLRGIADPTGLKTIQGYLKTLELLRPRAFLLENVPGFAYKVQQEAFDLVIGRANKLGYKCSWKIVNAADYGVPQVRKRFILVGTLNGEFKFPEPTHCDLESDEFNAKQNIPWRTAGDVLNDLDTKKNSCDKGHFAGGKHHDLLKQIPPGDNYLFFTEKRGHPNPQFKWRSRYWSFLLKLSPNRPSWTIQARRSNNMGPLHWRNRILRIEEVKRLQVFPDDWYLSGKIEDQWRQVGNAVPPKLAYVLGESLLSHLSEQSEQKRRIRG